MNAQTRTHETVAVDEQTDDLGQMEKTASTVAAAIGYVIGVDVTGSAHVHYPTADIVKVYDAGDEFTIGDRLDEDDVEHAESLEGRPLEHWMAYVEHERGQWQETTYRAPDRYNGGDA